MVASKLGVKIIEVTRKRVLVKMNAYYLLNISSLLSAHATKAKAEKVIATLLVDLPGFFVQNEIKSDSEVPLLLKFSRVVDLFLVESDCR